MGSIYTIYSLKDWKYKGKEIQIKDSGELAHQFVIAELDDFYCEDVEMYIRDSIMNKLRSGEYSISKDSKWKRQLIILNSAGEYVPPIAEDFCY